MKKKDLVKLNIGCGETKLAGFVNIDVEKKVKPDMVCDLRKQMLPFKDASVDLIQCIHNIEHIEQKYWPAIFAEFWRVLKPEAKLYLAYPEFERCSKNFLTNYKGLRDHWRHTLYGRQFYPGDYHVVPMVTPEVMTYLIDAGFKSIKATPEPLGQEHNTFVVAIRGKLMRTREAILKDEIFNK